MKKLLRVVAATATLVFLVTPLHAQVPNLVSYQGRVAVGATNFDGPGQFKFAFVNNPVTIAYWTNDGTHLDGTEPAAAVSLTVTKGLYSVLLGDTTLTNMTAIPASAFTNAALYLRVWFNDGTHGFQLLTPDQRIAPNAYLPDGSVSSAALASGSVTSAKIAVGAIGSVSIAPGSIGSSQLATGALLTPQTAAGTTQTAAANASYVATGTSSTAFILPTAANIGDVVQVAAAGPGGWSAKVGAGDTWVVRDAPRQWYAVASSSDGTKLVAVVAGGQIYTSADSGASWTARSTNREWFAVASSADGTKLVAAANHGQIYRSTNSGVSWSALAGSPTAEWRGISSSADGSKLLAAVENGNLYTSVNSGQNWVAREASRIWLGVASSSDGSKLEAVANGNRIFTSSDFGVNWTPRESNRGWRSIASSSDGAKLVAAEQGGRIYTSTDFGVNWTPHENIRNWYFVASSADGGRLAAVDQYGLIYISADFGATWAAGATARNWQCIASSADGATLAAVENSPTGQLVTSAGAAIASGAKGTNATLQYVGNGLWAPVAQTQVAAGAVGTAQLATGAVGAPQLATGAVTSAKLASGAVAPALSFAGTTQAALANTTYTATGALPATLDLTQTAAVAGDMVQITGTGAGGWTAGLSSWTARDSDRNWAAVASSASGVKLVAAETDGLIYTSNDSGASWTPRSSADTCKWQGVASSADGTKLVAVARNNLATGYIPGQIFTSGDSGITWTARAFANDWICVASSDNGNILIAGTQTDAVYISTDSGVNWTATDPTGYFGAQVVWRSLASSSDGTKLAAACNGYLYTSANSGSTWTDRTLWGLPQPVDYASVACSSDGTKLVTVVRGGKIWTSADAGASWTAHESNRSWSSVASSSDGRKLVATVSGGQTYISTDSGVTWIPLDSNRNWTQAASSADGAKVVAAVNGGKLYTGLTFMTLAAGPQGTHATLEYLGNGQWSPVAQTQIAAGSVGSNQIAAGAVGTTQLAAGAVGTTQLAAGSTAPPVTIAGASQTVAPNTTYVTTNPNATNITLPTLANFGDVIQINAAGAGGWSANVYDLSTWSQRAINTSWSAVASSADGTKLVAVDGAGYGTGYGSGGQIYTSTDSGINWTPRESNRRWQAVASSADGTMLAAVDRYGATVAGGAAGGRIYTSTDSGVTWTPRDSNRGWISVASSADGTKLVACANFVNATNGEHIYTSTNAGLTWTPRDSVRGWSSVASSADGTKLVATVSSDHIYTSTNSGVTWTASSAPFGSSWSCVASSADGSKLIAGVNGGRIYTSADSGASWTARESSRSWYSVASSSDGTKLAAVDCSGAGGLIYTSADSGVTWTPRETARDWVSVASSADGNKLIAGAFGGYLYTSGGVLGAQGSTTSLQYVGGGLWSTLAQSKALLTGQSVTQIAPGAVQQSNIAPRAVGPDQLDLYAVREQNIANWAVDSDKIAPYAVGNFQLADGSITLDKLSFDLGIWSGSNGNIYRTSGNVGIGTNNPINDLSVNGNANFTGLVGVGGVNARRLAVGYPLSVYGSPHGIAVDVNGANTDGSPNHANNFMLFTTDGGLTAHGSIQGQDINDLESSFDFKWFQDMYYAELAWQSAQIAADLIQLDIGSAAVSTTEFGIYITDWAKQAIEMEQGVGVVFQSGSGDYAEWLEKKDPAEDLKVAEIVGMTGGKISKNTTSAERCMIISTAPIVAGNMQPKDDEKRFKKVAFIGQVPVKVRGSVRTGDYVVASGLNDGYGKGISPQRMTLQDYKNIAGVAWSATADAQREGLVKVAVGINTNDLTDKLIQQQKQIDGIVSYLKAKDPAFPQATPVAAISSQPAQVEAAPVAAAPVAQAPVAGPAPDWAKFKQTIKEHPELFARVLGDAKERLTAKGLELTKHPRVAQALDVNYFTEWANSDAPTLEPLPPTAAAITTQPLTDGPQP